MFHECVKFENAKITWKYPQWNVVEKWNLHFNLKIINQNIDGRGCCLVGEICYHKS